MTRALGRFFERRPIPGIQAAYLFGSRGERRAHSESDIDIAVLLDPGVYSSGQSRSQARFELMLELMDHLSADEVDLVVLNDVPPSLVAMSSSGASGYALSIQIWPECSRGMSS